MKEFNFINIHDPYTFVADDLEVAALVVFSIGACYGAKSEDGEDDVPIFLFGGEEEWYVEKFGRTPDEGLDARKPEVAKALASMMLGHFGDRKLYELALEFISEPEAKEHFMAKWQDRRSSITDIGTYCHNLAKRLSEQ